MRKKLPLFENGASLMFTGRYSQHVVKLLIWQSCTHLFKILYSLRFTELLHSLKISWNLKLWVLRTGMTGPKILGSEPRIYLQASAAQIKGLSWREETRVVRTHTHTHSLPVCVCVRFLGECQAHGYAAVFEYLPDVWVDAQSECKEETVIRHNNLVS